MTLNKKQKSIFKLFFLIIFHIVFIISRFYFKHLTPHIISSVGVVFAILSIQCVDNIKFLKYQIFTYLVFAGCMLYLHAWTGVLLMIFAAVRMFVFYYFEKNNLEKNAFVLFFFIFIFIFITLFTWEGFVSLVLLLGFCIFTYGSWQSRRLILLISAYVISITNIIFNIYYGGYVNVVTELIMVASTTIALARYYKTRNS